MLTQSEIQIIQALSDVNLLTRTEEVAKEERQASLRFLHHLREVSRRKLFAESGFSTLFDYLTRGLGYSAPAAQRRIAGMQTLSEFPELESKIESGELSLSVVSQAHTFFRQEARLERPLDHDSKREILISLEGKSTREAERVLASQASETHYAEYIRPVSRTHTEIQVVFDTQSMEQFEKLRAILSHQSFSISEVMAEAVEIAADKLDPARETKRSLPAPEAAARQSTSRTYAIPKAIRRAVFRRDRSRCTYQDPKTGHKCGSRFLLEPDHIRTIALGGAHTLENLTLRCFQHNQLHALQDFGRKKMEKHWQPH